MIQRGTRGTGSDARVPSRFNGGAAPRCATATDGTERRLRVLLIAEAANPEWVSVSLEGWSHSRAIMGVADAHLVTQVRNREAILRAGLDEAQFTAIDSEAIAKRIWRLGSLLRGGPGRGWTTLTALNAISYRYFERLVWREFGPRIEAGEFDIVHRITPLSPTTPSPLAGWCRRCRGGRGVPFVMGPLNGGVPWPRGFDHARRREREWLSYLRSAHRLMPGYHATRRNAAAIIIGSRDTWRQMPARYHGKCVYIPENAIDPARFPPSSVRRPQWPLRLIFVGRLVPYKGADMLLEAAAPLLRSGEARLTIVGDGPQSPQVRAVIARLGVSDAIDMPGWVPHEQLQRHLSQADVFAFPSVREFGGAVVLEAMAMGLVPVVLNYGGPGELVTDSSGYRIEMGTRPQIIERLRTVLERIVSDPDALPAKARCAVARAREQFTWEAKAAMVLEVYRWVLGEREKPAFGMPLPEASLSGSVSGAVRSDEPGAVPGAA